MQTNTILAQESSRAWTGSRMIDVLDPDPEDILLPEIAIGLSREVRYGGAATAVPWSVGQHSLLCDDMAEADGLGAPDVRLCILLHDAPEYMLRDLISPVKRQLPGYQGLESTWWKAVARKYSLPFDMPGIVKHYDMLAAATEKAALVAPEAGEWPGLPAPRELPSYLLGLSQRAVASEFQRRIECQVGRIPGSHPCG